MTNTDNVTVQRMIVHKVDHKKYDAPLLSDLESPIEDEVRSFLRQHIALNQEHKRVRTARFLEPSDGAETVCTLCDDIFADASHFVQRSRQIATHLFQSMTGDGRISPGDLVICTFSEGEDQNLQWLAILKMDLNDGFVGERRGEKGQKRVILRRVPDVLPTGGLQKCAFILPSVLRKKYDLLVLDQQTGRHGAKKPVASFFLKKFMKCEVGFERKEGTQVFVLQSQAWVTQKKDTWPTEDIALFKERTIEAVRANIIDVVAFAHEMIQDPDEQEEYLTHVRQKGLRELTFEPDPEERNRWTRYTWFKGDDDLQVKIRSEAVGEDRTLDWVLDKTTNTYVVTIRTANWEPLLKRG